MEMTLQQRQLTSALASDLFLRFTNSNSANLKAAELTERDGHIYSFTCAPSQPSPRLQRLTHQNWAAHQCDIRQMISLLNIRPGSDDTRAVMASFATVIWLPVGAGRNERERAVLGRIRGEGGCWGCQGWWAYQSRTAPALAANTSRPEDAAFDQDVVWLLLFEFCLQRRTEVLPQNISSSSCLRHRLNFVHYLREPFQNGFDALWHQ